MAGNNALRVLSGALKGKTLRSPHNIGTHPMGSREKLALFNMLQPYLEGAKILDAYAGTGALGIEALSRGASSVTFVEKNPSIARLIRENLQIIGMERVECEVFTGSVREFAQKVELAGKYDLILADPPYDKFDTREIASLIRLLSDNGILALSFPFRKGVPDFLGLELQTSRQYASAGIAIYRRNS